MLRRTIIIIINLIVTRKHHRHQLLLTIGLIRAAALSIPAHLGEGSAVLLAEEDAVVGVEGDGGIIVWGHV